MQDQFYFPAVTLMVTHYNRSVSLERLLSTFQKFNCRFDDIVVADDASRPEHLEKLKALQHVYNFRLVTTEKNGGIAANINKGRDAVDTPYTLYVQEDFTPLPGCMAHMLDALQIMNERPDIDYIRFWSFYRYPVLKPFGKGFSEAAYSHPSLDRLKFCQYSDNPHLHRSNFPDKFGRFNENVTGDLAEFKFAISFIKNKGKALFYNNFSTLFSHENSCDEPSTQHRANLKHRKNILFQSLYAIYVRLIWARYTLYLMFTR